MAFYNPYYPNAQQDQLNRLMQQRQMLDSQIAMLNQPAQPAVNVNVGQNQPAQAQAQTPPAFMQTPSTYDAGVVYIDNYDEAKKAATANIPVMYMEKERPYLHLKGADGNLTTFKLEQIQMDTPAEDSALQKQVNTLENKLDMLINALTQQQAPAPVPSAMPEEKPKPAQSNRKKAEG